MYLSPIWRVTTSSSATFCCVEAFDRYRYLTRYRAVSRVLYLARERAAVKIQSRCANRADAGTRNRVAMNTRLFTAPNTYLNYRKLMFALTFHYGAVTESTQSSSTDGEHCFAWGSTASDTVWEPLHRMGQRHKPYTSDSLFHL